MIVHFKILLVIGIILRIVMYKIFKFIIKKIKIVLIKTHNVIQNLIQKYLVNFYPIYNLIELTLNLSMDARTTNNNLYKWEEFVQMIIINIKM